MSGSEVSEHLKIPFEKIKEATEDFKECIGSGGYGPVYKGKLLVNGKSTKVAVKRLNGEHGQGVKEFETEIILLSDLEHPNLISLVGCCKEENEKSIVYEYAEGGSLDNCIRRINNTGNTLSWLYRLKICTHAARGLHHLHNHVVGENSVIIHRDIKSSNILIDENGVAKISDFGLSKLKTVGMSLVSNVCGTPGYIEPEYFETGNFTEKCDVYSFGIVLFEVFCGRLCRVEYNDGFSLSGKSAKEHYENKSLDKIIDPRLKKHIRSDSMIKFSDIAYRCLIADREKRPAMDDVKKELEEALKLEESPKQSDLAADQQVMNVESPLLGRSNVMNVVLVAAECTSLSKTGGLGDVAGALPKALAKLGHRVMVVVPHYKNYAEPPKTGVWRSYDLNGQAKGVHYFQKHINGVDFVVIANPIFENLKSNMYGGNRQDFLQSMVLFCKAAIEAPWHVLCEETLYDDRNLVFIANDWRTALLPVYLKAYYHKYGHMIYARSVLVIHNIAHQCRVPLSEDLKVDLDHQPDYLDKLKMNDPVDGDHYNILAAGIKTAHRIVTVLSHGSALELKTLEGGQGLHGIIRENYWKLKGIVNGIDKKEWNPEVDTHLTTDDYANYSLETLDTRKPKCKATLQKELGLPIRPEVPLIGYIGRLGNQKGVELIIDMVPWMDVQLVMLGSGDSNLEQMLREMENRYSDKVRGHVEYSDKMAHRITAGADILLMPSKFEPYELSQFNAMCYGTIPVVHAVGGLNDTVQPFDHTLENCLSTYRNDKWSWEGIQKRGMEQVMSWDKAAKQYEKVLFAAKYQA